MSPPTTGIPWQKWQDAWSDWVTSAGLQPVWALQAENAPEPRFPFASLRVFGLDIPMLDEIFRIDVATDPEGRKSHETLAGVRQIRLHVEVVANAKGVLADSAWPWVDELISCLRREPTSGRLNVAGLSFVDLSSSPIDISAIEQSQFVSRVAFDVRFEGAYYRINPEGGGTVKEVTGEVVDENDQNLLTFDVSGES